MFFQRFENISQNLCLIRRILSCLRVIVIFGDFLKLSNVLILAVWLPLFWREPSLQFSIHNIFAHHINRTFFREVSRRCLKKLYSCVCVWTLNTNLTSLQVEKTWNTKEFKNYELTEGADKKIVKFFMQRLFNICEMHFSESDAFLTPVHHFSALVSFLININDRRRIIDFSEKLL